MKEKLKNKLGQKIIVVIAAIIMLFNIIFPTHSYAADVGGILLSPIVELVCSIGDVVVVMMEQCINGETNSSAFSLSFSPFMVSNAEFFGNSFSTYKGEDIAISKGNEKTLDKAKTVTVDKEEYQIVGMDNKYRIPVYLYGPDVIFSNQADMLKINFFDPGEDGETNTASVLQTTIASWYKSLRNLTIVGLLCILVYVGIRIIISTTAGDKAKYKQMLMDWLIALCLVFFLHYIMAFAVMVTEEISNAISSGTTEIYVKTQFLSPTTYGYNREGGDNTNTGTGIFKTNLMGYARFMSQTNKMELQISYLIMYLALVIYTVIFTWIYLKRVLTIAFLTLMAPVVALTYPIDKMNDGKAQAFDAWLKEYVYNVLIQPFHLIIYTTLVTSAMDLASTNIIYVIAALGFMLPAEKILKKFFGFDKASGGTMGSLASGAILGSMAQKAAGAIASASSKGSSKSTSGSEVKLPEGEKQPRFEADKVDLNNLDKLDEFDLGSEKTKEMSMSQKMERESLQEKLADGQLSESDLSEEQKKLLKMNGEGFEQEDPVKRMERESLQEKLADGQITEKDLSKEQKRLLGLNQTRKPNRLSRTMRTISGAAGRVNRRYGITKQIPGAMRFVAGTAFKASAGTLAAAVTMASGGGVAGGLTAFGLGSTVANKASGAAFDKMGTARSDMREFVDTVRGNTKLRDADAKREWYKDSDNKEKAREILKKKNGGYMPTEREVNKYMKELSPYLEQGITDVKQASKAYDTAKNYGISDKQSAMIAAIGNEREITKDVLNDEKKYQAQLKNLRHEFKEKGLNQKQADMVMEVLKAQNGVAHNLKKKK